VHSAFTAISPAKPTVQIIMSFQTILALDTALPTSSIAIMHEKGSITRQLAQGSQAKSLMFTIAQMLRQADMGMQDIQTIVTSIGPGSFTGIRIGLSSVHGLCLAREHTLKTCSSLQAMAFDYFSAHADATQVKIWLNAGRLEAYTQCFSHDNLRINALDDIALFSLDAIQNTNSAQIANAGNIAGVCYEIPYINTVNLCAMAAQLPDTSLADTMPIYVRAPDAKPPAALPWLAKQQMPA
jgi:tRNA threonylcarbamoyladenosine biosynthesis protein TsaB